jgi:hypothetical protein
VSLCSILPTLMHIVASEGGLILEDVERERERIGFYEHNSIW